MLEVSQPRLPTVLDLTKRKHTLMSFDALCAGKHVRIAGSQAHVRGKFNSTLWDLFHLLLQGLYRVFYLPLLDKSFFSCAKLSSRSAGILK